MRPSFATADALRVVARNVAPLAGVLFLGWNARNVLYLYYADTLLAMAVILAGVLRHMAPPVTDEGWAARLSGEAGAVAAGTVAALIVGVPLGIGLVFMLDGRMAIRETLSDPGFRTALAWQAVAACWSYAALWRELPHRSLDELKLKRRFSLVFLRWLAMLGLAYTGIGHAAGSQAAIVFVALYAAISTWAEIAPDHFLRTMPGGAEDAEPAPRRGRRRSAGGAPTKRRDVRKR